MSPRDGAGAARDRSRTPGWAAPPRWLVWAAVVLLVVLVVTLLLGAASIGLTVDEKYHVVRTTNFLQRGWYLLDDDFAGREPGSWVTDAYVYSPVTSLLLHGANLLLGHDAPGSVSASADAYAVRHLGVAVIGLVGVACAAAITRVLSGSWRWGVVTAAVLLCLPMWTGHAMFNVKDVPVGTGYTLVTLGCLLLLRASRRTARPVAAAGALVVAGIVLGMGTRPAIWPGLAAATGWVVLTVLLQRRGADHGLRPRDWWRVGVLALAWLVGIGVLALVYPNVFAHPLAWPLASSTESSGYQGERFWAYIPVAICLTVPVGLLVLGVAGSWARVSAWLRAPGRGVQAAWCLVLLQALLLPLLLTVRPAAFNGGLRHVLFAAPAVAVLVTAGMEQVLRDLRSRVARGVFTALCVVSLASPALAQVQSFPYGYGYSNEVADELGLSLASDAWQASFREYAADVEPGDFVVCGAGLDDDDRPMRSLTVGGPWLALGQNCATGENTALSPYLGEVAPPQGVADDFLALIYRFDRVPAGCEEVDRVTRTRLWTTHLLSTALRCPLVLPAYDGPVRLDGAGRGAAHLLGGWSGSGGDPWVSTDDEASVGFFLPQAPDGVTLLVSGEATGSVSFLVNNETVDAQEVEGGWRLDVDSPGSLGEPGNLAVTVRVTGGTAHVSGVEVVDRTRTSP